MNAVARPTEYRGIAFRSKSEAIVARAFDLLHISWFYEPNVGDTCYGWRPDFFISWPWKSRPGFSPLLLEFKPIDPTDTYREELLERFERIQSPWVIPALLVVDPFDCSRPAFIDQCLGGSWRRLDSPGMVHALSSTIWNARSHRFDLNEPSFFLR